MNIFMKVIKSKILNVFFIFLFLVTSLFSATLEIKSVKSLNEGKDIVFELSTTSIKPIYKSTYDSKNHMLYLEISNGSSKTPLKSFQSEYIDSIQSISTGSGTGYFVNTKIGVKYSTKLEGNKLTLSFSKSTSSKEFVIVIDAGHGGKDPGAVYFGTNEKDIVLNVAKDLKELLDDKYTVILTRESDKYLYLSDRPKVGNSKKANMFISIHANASTSSSLEGVEVFYFSKTSSPYAAKVAAYENSFGDKYGEKTGNISQILGELEYTKYQEVSAKVAKDMTDDISSTLGMKNRGIQGANFAVLRGFGTPRSVAPGVLVEIGFLSNKSDYAKIVDRDNQKIIAKSIADAVNKHFY